MKILEKTLKMNSSIQVKNNLRSKCSHNNILNEQCMEGHYALASVASATILKYNCSVVVGCIVFMKNLKK